MTQLPDGYALLKSLPVLAWFALLFLAERWHPAARPASPEGARRVGRNLALWLVNVAASTLVVLPLTAWAVSHHFGLRPDAWSGWPGTVLDLVLLDLLIYWWHRANHQWPPLWRFHRVHHLDRFLDSTSALRFHVGEVLLSALARSGVILLLGFPFASILLFEALLLIAAIFHHSNLRMPPRLESALSKAVVTPAIHWVHHHAVRADTDSNYATIFSAWDRLFGSRSPTPRSPAMAIGVEGESERPLPQLLLRPFLRR